jgi:hypothetical protein
MRLNVRIGAYFDTAPKTSLDEGFTMQMDSFAELNRTSILVLEDRDTIPYEDIIAETQMVVMDGGTGCDKSFLIESGKMTTPIIGRSKPGGKSSGQPTPKP